MTSTTKRGRKPGTDKLDASAQRALLDRLRTDTGPVNLKSTAAEAGISRTTLMRYIDAEPGLREVLDQRRASAGRGYVLDKRRPKVVKKVVASVKPRDRLPTGPQAAVMEKLWRGTAAGYRTDVERGDSSMEERLLHATAHADVFRALASGSVHPDEAQARLDALPEPAPRQALDAAFVAKRRAEEEVAAQKFKAIHGYRPSARKVDALLNRSGISYTPEEWKHQEFQRALALERKLNRLRTKPRKSYPSRPKDPEGRPLVKRGRMAQLQREQEAKGLSGQAAKDAAFAVALAEVAAAKKAADEGQNL